MSYSYERALALMIQADMVLDSADTQWADGVGVREALGRARNELGVAIEITKQRVMEIWLKDVAANIRAKTIDECAVAAAAPLVGYVCGAGLDCFWVATENARDAVLALKAKQP